MQLLAKQIGDRFYILRCAFLTRLTAALLSWQINGISAMLDNSAIIQVLRSLGIFVYHRPRSAHVQRLSNAMTSGLGGDPFEEDDMLTQGDIRVILEALKYAK